MINLNFYDYNLIYYLIISFANYLICINLQIIN